MRLTHTEDSLKMLEFAQKHEGWHTYSLGKRTIKALSRLLELKRIETSGFGQFKAIN